MFKKNEELSIKPSDETIKQAANFIAQHEGLRLKVYDCPAKVKTIGYGHALKKGENLTEITKSKAYDLLLLDTTIALLGVLKNTKVSLNTNQQIALTSFTFNLGIKAYIASTLRQKLNRGEYFEASNEFSRWIHGGGRILKGLVRRRAEERELFLT